MILFLLPILKDYPWEKITKEREKDRELKREREKHGERERGKRRGEELRKVNRKEKVYKSVVLRLIT